ncbi:MAG: prepilin-type N-terminal cleavage/methylation domain-containing protein [Tildeniella nuda ZEHNDER 1965/U140]|jgi:prepilin-type N-terminal cleavage/methylation domain-containing protein|nr:prepilin-type N-terminal cleavage/methylation domain-containing protein [Tildeniella nuda ZEHNDER 1965/U140]
MKPSVKQFSRGDSEGFTLIELLVVIVIVSILSAIALPSFLNQASKAKETESKQYIGALNRAHQAYFLEKNTFTEDFSLLGLGIKTQTTNYTYAIQDNTETSAINVSFPQNPVSLRAHVGGVSVGSTTGAAGGELTTLAVLCQSQKPQAGDPAGVTFVADAGPSCAGSFDNLANY